ncbi:DUF2149 domain-containing protein [Singulisphaera rosea]
MSEGRRKRRRWDAQADDDPLAGLINLFDLWMVFSIALLIVFTGSLKARSPHKPLPTPPRDAQNLDRVRVSREALNRSGERLGTAYRLPSGEVVCVPDADTK